MLRRLSFDQMTTKIRSNVTDVMFLSVDYNIDADDDDNKISVHFALDPKIFHRIMTSCSLPTPPCATGHSRCLESLCGDFLYIAVTVIGAIQRSRD